MSKKRETELSSLERSEFIVRKERLYGQLLAACAVLTIAVTVGIILSLSGQALTFFGHVSPIDFLTGQNWSPLSNTPSYGVIPLISGTLIVTVGSAVIALPVGLGAAIYLSEYASSRVRGIVKPLLEILAGIPTVIYGYFALVYLTPLLDAPLPIRQTIIPGEFVLVVPSISTFNALSASIAVGVMIIPMVSSISEDALSAVPDSLREAGYGLGSTKFDVSTSIVVPAATSGIVSSYVLALSRAIGETMIVVVAAGESPKMPTFPNILENFTESIETMTVAMVNIASAESLGETVAYESMFAIGLTLFAITLTMNYIAELISRQYREEY
ncbi:phosphate ABC transporter permease subunit PstC [Halobacteriales archaeon QH_2_66_30]|nr:MAG: phosphate ABC transporter permease subunit PstC [Halobacteriales archaeon QH_2_66_30]PSQ48295.1 MAG: phosphate ABC transporter permease subunit PstC [Halobacteriales archaeon SW_7_65_23]